MPGVSEGGWRDRFDMQKNRPDQRVDRQVRGTVQHLDRRFDSERLRLAISLRRRPPEAKAAIGIALSRRSRKLSEAEVASSFGRTSTVTAFALFRARARGMARTARRMADSPRAIIWRRYYPILRLVS